MLRVFLRWRQDQPLLDYSYYETCFNDATVKSPVRSNFAAATHKLAVVSLSFRKLFYIVLFRTIHFYLKELKTILTDCF